jgi:hypothetical protein
MGREVLIEDSPFASMTLCNLVHVHLRFGGNSCLHIQGSGAAHCPRNQINDYQTKRRHIPEDGNLKKFSCKFWILLSTNIKFNKNSTWLVNEWFFGKIINLKKSVNMEHTVVFYFQHCLLQSLSKITFTSFSWVVHLEKVTITLLVKK